MTSPSWLTVARGKAPLLLTMPHTGIQIPARCMQGLVSAWLARKDTDWWVHRLYGCAAELGATVLRTAVSRTVIDANRDPSGQSLYPGQATTALCPTTTFDGEPLYRPGHEPDSQQISSRRREFFDPYHAAVAAELTRLRRAHPCVVLYDCHAIRSTIPRLFAGTLPNFNIGTQDGRTCAAALLARIEAACPSRQWSRVSNGRFKGGYTVRRHGLPDHGVHAVQMELACRTYLQEPAGPPTAENWPPEYDEHRAAALRRTLNKILQVCLTFAHQAH